MKFVLSNMNLSKNIKAAFYGFLFLLICSNLNVAQQLAFPTAEGYGKFSKGGRGGRVIEVTRLDDDTKPGSLRYAISQSGPRTVVFKVSGTITLNSRLTIKNPYITIAGQTAPGDGICIRKYPLMIEASHCIVRYLRVRLGDESGEESDAMGGKDNGVKNIIIDHCSVSWSVDETLSPYLNDSLTVQWCLVSESLYNSNHAKGAHGYGGIWGGNNNTYHHNLLAHHTSRNPRFASACGLNDYRNNVVYNWGFNSTYGGENYLNGLTPVAGQFTNINMVANYYKAGPGTKAGVIYRIVNPSTRNGATDAGKWYVANNYVVGSSTITANNWAGGVQASQALDIYKATVPFNTMPNNEQTAEEAYQSVLENVGANLPKRDAIDQRIVNEVKNGNATYEGKTYKSAQGFPASAPVTGMIDTQADVGGWPLLLTGPGPTDTDHDGMPDVWEKANGLSSTDASDGNGIGKDGYTNLENYLNSITEFPSFLQAPTELKGELNTVSSIKLVWQDNCTTEKGLTLERAIGAGDYQVYKSLPANTVSFLDENLAELTLYKYRVSCFSDSLQSAYSNETELTTMSATSKPLVAGSPNPANAENLVNVNSTLQWKAGLSSVSHDVYFGTTTPPAFVKNQTSTEYVPASLQKGTKYYWRVDEVNQNGKTTGTVWSFTTKAVLPPQKIAHWKFDEVSGTTTKDDGTYKNNGSFLNILHNPRVTGYIGGALSFNGISGSVVVPHNGSIDFGKESFSISYWLKVGTLTGASMYPIQKGSFVRDTSISASGKWYGFEIKSNALRFSIDDDVVKSTASVANVDTLLKSRWNHVVGIRDSASSQLKIYVNGKLLNSSASTTGNISENEALYFGNTLSDNASLSGAMDDVRFYNYSLTEQEVNKIFTESATGIEREKGIPSEISLCQNYPNPFNPTTKITFSLPKDGMTSLSIYNLLGEKVASLVNEELQAGVHSYSFDASQLSSGVYFYRLNSEQSSLTKKMIVVK